ncbi:ABC transporter permease [candidate division KSB1 bacterium]
MKIPFLQSIHLPKLFLRLILRKREYTEFSNDLYEIYSYMSKHESKKAAVIWYWKRVFESTPSIISDRMQWSLSMFRNNIIIAVRNIRKYKSISILNIIGFAVALMCCMITLLLIQNFYSIDRFHENIDRIYYAYSMQNTRGEEILSYSTPEPLAPAIKERIPGITASARLRYYNRAIVKSGDKKFYESGICFADPSFLDIFTFPLTSSSNNTPLSSVNDVLITREIAQKYFADENPIGKVLTINTNTDVRVSGILEDIPLNSSISFDFLLPFESPLNRRDHEWGNRNTNTYMLFQENTSLEEFNKTFTEWKTQFPLEGIDIRVQLFSDIYLHGLENYGGMINDLILMVSLSVIILLTGCFNFVNLTTAISDARAHEIGVRKVIGAERKNIILQFLGESVVISFISLALAVILAYIAVPLYNNIQYQRPLEFNYFTNILLLPGSILLTFVTAILSGAYPAFVISSFNPVRSMRGIIKSGSNKQLIRRIFLVIQFTISSAFLIYFAVILNQNKYEMSMDRGFEYKNIVYVGMKGEIGSRYELFRNDLLATPGIHSVSSGSVYPTGYPPREMERIKWEGKDPLSALYVYHIAVDKDYISLYDLEIVQGRDFSQDTEQDSENYILNETAVELMGLESPVGSPFSMFGKEGMIIGVLKDYHFQMMSYSIKPLVLRKLPPEELQYVFVKIDEGTDDMAGILASMKSTWDRYAPDYPFECFFMEDRISSEYNFLGFGYAIGFIVIMIPCLGLYAMVTLMIQRQRKEVAVRKVMGATIRNIVMYNLAGFLKIILMSLLIGCSLGWFMGKMIRESMPYPADLGWEAYVFPCMIVLFIAVFTILYHVIRSACVNPVDSLRYE